MSGGGDEGDFIFMFDLGVSVASTHTWDIIVYFLRKEFDYCCGK